MIQQLVTVRYSTPRPWCTFRTIMWYTCPVKPLMFSLQTDLDACTLKCHPSDYQSQTSNDISTGVSYIQWIQTHSTVLIILSNKCTAYRIHTYSSIVMEDKYHLQTFHVVNYNLIENIPLHNMINVLPTESTRFRHELWKSYVIYNRLFYKISILLINIG